MNSLYDISETLNIDEWDDIFVEFTSNTNEFRKEVQKLIEQCNYEALKYSYKGSGKSTDNDFHWEFDIPYKGIHSVETNHKNVLASEYTIRYEDGSCINIGTSTIEFLTDNNEIIISTNVFTNNKINGVYRQLHDDGSTLSIRSNPYDKGSIILRQYKGGLHSTTSPAYQNSGETKYYFYGNNITEKVNNGTIKFPLDEKTIYELSLRHL